MTRMRKRSFIALAVGLVLMLPLVFATLDCTIQASCSGDEVEMLGLSALSNAHAAMPGSAYAHKVCCSGLSGLSNAQGTPFLNLTSSLNAHAKKVTGSGVGATSARISSSGIMNCIYGASCPSQYACLASVEKDSNAHVGNCNAYPSGKICCGCADTSEISQPNFCSDGIDNDCDGLTDCADPECDGAIQGEIMSIDDVLIAGAVVKGLLGTTVKGSGTSNDEGEYSFPIPCGTYSLAIDAFDFARVTRVGVVVPPRTTITENFTGETGLAKSDSCESDCTFVGSSLVHASCEGINGCSFYPGASVICDNTQPGWTRSFDESNDVVCPSGPLRGKNTDQANIQCSKEVCSKATSPVLYNGKQVKLVVVVSG